MSQNVIYFKALNDQEVVARLIEETDTHVTIEKARVIAMQNGNTPGEMTLGLVPWFLGNPDATIDIAKDKIFARPRTISPQLEKGYLQQTSGIDLSAAG